MRLLIDGYNVLYAGGRLGMPLRPDAFRKVRTRFLNELAEALGPFDAGETTVVFDASAPLERLPARSTHKGITVVYAVNDEDADARIERLILEQGNPKALKVVSSDRRVRLAATRRKAASVTAEDFWVELDARRAARQARRPQAVPEAVAPMPRAGEGDDWEAVFADLDELPETREALGDPPGMLTDAEVAAIEREVEREAGPNLPRLWRRPEKGGRS